MKTAPMTVTLIDNMGSDKTVCNAARASFGKSSDGELTNQDISLIKFLARGYTDAEWLEVANMLALSSDIEEIKLLMWQIKTKATHFAPLAHPQISLRIEAPLAIARQMWKSHVGASGGDNGYPAWSECSRRYIDSEPAFYMPNEFRKRGDNVKQGSGDEVVDYNSSKLDLGYAYTKGEDIYTSLLETGVAPEQARLALSTGMMVSWTWTGSLMFFARLCQLRIEAHAQKESQEVALMISDIVRPLYPVSWEALMTGDVK